jgi:hypothetical protein
MQRCKDYLIQVFFCAASPGSFKRVRAELERADPEHSEPV